MFYEATIIDPSKPTAQELPVHLVGVAVPVVTTEVGAMTVEEELVQLKAKLAELQDKNKEGGEDKKMPKNKRRVKADPNRKYVRLGSLRRFGRVPKQQEDIAAILEESMDLGAEWTEEEVFCLLEDSQKEYESLRKSGQHITYLFAYYRGLKNDGKHAGFIARDFLRQIG